MRKTWVFVMAAACGGNGGDDDDVPVDGAPLTEIPELDLTLREQVAKMEAQELTSVALLENYRARLARLDDNGANAVLAYDPTSATVAATVDGLRGNGALLQGAVILVKDNIDTAGLATTAGSIAMKNNVPATDATAVAKLRAANGVIVGKANLSEWANFRGFSSTSGWSSLGQQTTHAVVPAYNPCGSSSGSGVAVALNEVSAALGTETNGSIVCPAAINGVVGFKPTVGLVSRAGVIPISVSQDTIGPITRDVGDAARLLGVIAGPDPGDQATNAIPANFDFDFDSQIVGASLAGKRIGVVRLGGFDGGTIAVYDAELARLEDAGAVLVPVTLPSLGAVGDDPYIMLIFEFKDGINSYLASHPVANQPATLADLIAFNSANTGLVMPFFGQEIFLDAQATTDLSSQTYIDAKTNTQQAVRENGILAVMNNNNLDALVSPTFGPAWLTDYDTGDRGTASCAAFPAIAGYPHLTVPMGEVNGFPVGLSFFGRPFEDGKILALGHAYEQVRPAKRTSVWMVSEPVQTIVIDPRSRAGM